MGTATVSHQWSWVQLLKRTAEELQRRLAAEPDPEVPSGVRKASAPCGWRTQKAAGKSGLPELHCVALHRVGNGKKCRSMCVALEGGKGGDGCAEGAGEEKPVIFSSLRTWRISVDCGTHPPRPLALRLVGDAGLFGHSAELAGRRHRGRAVDALRVLRAAVPGHPQFGERPSSALPLAFRNL
eukprot:scaffold1330_cov240-Pinguiococcus_pyrenoidosus.AAC.41